MTVVVFVLVVWAVLLPVLLVSTLSACRAAGTRRLARSHFASRLPTLTPRRQLVAEGFARTRGGCATATALAVPPKRHARR